jgi:hypothetical protein
VTAYRGHSSLTSDIGGKRMRHLRWLIGLTLIGLVGTVSAQWREDGKPVADSEWRKAWGKYGAMLDLTDKPDELFAAWEKPGASVPLSTVEIARRGEPIMGVVFFSGCTPSEAGLCDSQVLFQVFKPDGSPYGAEEKAELWSGKPPPSQGELELSIGAIGVRIEPQDPNGTYLVRARLLDNVSHTTVELTRSFRVSPMSEAKKGKT